MTFTVVIPARFASTRLPGKPLRDIAGKPMIQHVYECAQQSGAESIVVATDDAKVAAVVEAFGGKACMTAGSHRSGTERLSEVVDSLKLDSDHIVVNLQGDEPLMPPLLIHQVAENLNAFSQASVATLAERIHSAEDLFDPHVVKVVMDQDGYAIYFSRAPIPWDRDAFSVTTDALPEEALHYRHIGLYAYRAGYIKGYVESPACALEAMESLEQLRVLWQGHKIHVAEALAPVVAGVDTEKDLERVRRVLKDIV